MMSSLYFEIKIEEGSATPFNPKNLVACDLENSPSKSLICCSLKN